MNQAALHVPQASSLSQRSIFEDLGEFLNVYDVAQLLDCAEATVEEILRRGGLPGIKIGRGWIVPKLGLIDCINKMAVEAARGLKIEAGGKSRKAVLLEMRRAADGTVQPAAVHKRPGRKRDPSKDIIFPGI